MERESSLEERERKDKEKAEAIRERQERLGHVPTPLKTGESQTRESEESEESE